jgi:aspartate kinase
MVRNIYVRHEQLAESLVEGNANSTLDGELRGEFQILESLLHRIADSRSLDARLQDQLLGFGECFSSKLVTEALLAAGLSSSHVDARSCIVTDARHGEASPDWEATNPRIPQIVEPLLSTGRIPVLGGFIAATTDGIPTTLGRGGSDFTASIVGAALGASRIEIWTDVDGVMTTDPKLCPDARVIRRMSFDEASELAHFGAKVLHPATLAPAMRENIPVYVLNSRRPQNEGTEIIAEATHNQKVRAISAKRNVAAVEIAPRGKIDSELLGAIFSAFDQHACPVEVMATSPGRISLLVASTVSLPGVAADLQGIADVTWQNHQALICLVGENIRRQPEVASRVFAAVSDMDVRVLCHGASERTISFLVHESRAEESVRKLHSVFFPKIEPVRDWGGTSTAFCQAG